MSKLDYVKLREIVLCKPELIYEKLPFKPLSMGIQFPIDEMGLRVAVEVKFEEVQKMPLTITINDNGVVYSIPLEVSGASDGYVTD